MSTAIPTFRLRFKKPYKSKEDFIHNIYNSLKLNFFTPHDKQHKNIVNQLIKNKVQNSSKN